MSLDADAPQLLAVIVDVESLAWNTASFTINESIEALLVFFNGFSMLHPQNQLAVFASRYGVRKSCCLFS